MNVRVKQTSNGTYEFQNHMRGPDFRSKWEVFKDYIYDPVNGTVFGHTKRRWGIVGLFYLVFYSALTLLCAICTMGLLATIDDHRPKYTLDSSIIGTNPGLGFRPISERTEERSLIWYISTNSTEVRKWTTRLDKFLDNYLNKSKLAHSGRDQMICDYDKPPKEGKACAVDMGDWGKCKSSEDYGFNNSQPCVFIKLNRIYDWVPEYYNGTENLPSEMPDDLKQHIKSIEKSKLNTVWVSCRGENPFDRENIGDLIYYPRHRGFSGYYYPYTNHPEYLSPIVAIQFSRPKRNVLINVECRAWAKNIIYKSEKGEKSGAVHFELMIDDEPVKA